MKWQIESLCRTFTSLFGRFNLFSRPNLAPKSGTALHPNVQPSSIVDRHKARILRWAMVVLLMIGADCSLFAPKPAQPSRFLPRLANRSGNWAECSTESASMIECWAQGSEQKCTILLVSLLEWKLRGKGWKAVLHLLCEKFSIIVK